MRKYCDQGGCGKEARGLLETTLIAYGVSGAVLAVPFFNAIGADVKNVASVFSTSWTNVSLTAVIIAIAWVLSGFISSVEKHSNLFLTAIHAMGIPGLVLGLIAIIGGS